MSIGENGAFTQDGQKTYNVELELLQVLEADDAEPHSFVAIAIAIVIAVEEGGIAHLGRPKSVGVELGS